LRQIVPELGLIATFLDNFLMIVCYNRGRLNVSKREAAMAQERPDYLSYLLRMWRAREGGSDVWRASLHSPQTGEQVSFRTLDELFVFLRRETGTAV
jgi:hypothetical protein